MMKYINGLEDSVFLRCYVKPWKGQGGTTVELILGHQLALTQP